MSCLGGVLVPAPLPIGAQKKQIFVFALRACGAISALFTRTGRCPLAYYLVLAFLSLSQRDLHHQVLSVGLFYVHTDCIFLPLCLSFWICKVCSMIYSCGHANRFTADIQTKVKIMSVVPGERKTIVLKPLILQRE